MPSYQSRYAILLSLVISTLLPAQTELSGESVAERAAMLGRVTRLDGKPWAKAEIHFFSRPLGAIGFGEPDHVRCLSSARGRFRCRLIAGREYSAWAIGTGADKHDASIIAEGVYAGTPLRLAQDPYPRPPTRLRLRIAKEYRERLDKFRIRFVAPMRNQFTVEIPISGRECTVPTLPGRIGIAEILDEKRRPILVYRFLTTLDQALGEQSAPPGFGWTVKFQHMTARAQALAMIKHGRVRNFGVQLRPTRRTKVQVVALDGDTPIAGARIFARVQYSTSSVRWEYEDARRVTWIEVGRSGSDGSCVAVLPDSALHKTYWNDIVLSARAPGFVSTQLLAPQLERKSSSASIITMITGTKEHGKKATDPLRFRLAKAPVTELMLSTKEGAKSSVAHRVMRLITTKSMNEGENETWSLTTVKRRVESDAEGRLVIPGIRPECQFVLQMAVDGPLLADLGIRDAPMPMSTVLLYCKDQGKQKLPKLALDALRCFDLTIKNVDGSPARGARVTLLPIWRERIWDLEGTSLALKGEADRRGRARFLAGPCPGDVLIVDTERHEYAYVALRNGRLKAREIQLKAMKRIRGRVIDRNGRPVPEAPLSLRLQLGGDATDAFRELLDDVATKTGSTDRDGRFELFVIPLDIRQIEIEAESKDGSVETEVELSAQHEEEVEIELDFELPAEKRANKRSKGRK